MSKTIFTKNLKRVRELKGWTQKEAAAESKVTIKNWGSYEEGRAFPPPDSLSSIAEAFGFEDDLYGFINNKDFFDAKGRRTNLRKVSKFDRKYHSLLPPIRQAVDALMKVTSV